MRLPVITMAIPLMIASGCYHKAAAPGSSANASPTAAKERQRRGQALYAMAMRLKAQAERENEANAESHTKEVEQQLSELEKNYADVPFAGQTLGELARGELREMRLLGIGKPAPEIEGTDIDGHVFKLSDYRGKVVLLDFWGNW